MVLSEDEVIVIVAVAESSSETFCGSVRKETLRKRSEMIHRVSWPRKAEAISIYYGPSTRFFCSSYCCITLSPTFASQIDGHIRINGECCRGFCSLSARVLAGRRRTGVAEEEWVGYTNVLDEQKARCETGTKMHHHRPRILP
jgi:hypothetical protein